LEQIVLQLGCNVQDLVYSLQSLFQFCATARLRRSSLSHCNPSFRSLQVLVGFEVIVVEPAAVSRATMPPPLSNPICARLISPSR
jgi:hypothetical protein